MKKFSAIILCFLMILTCTLTGCSTFYVNRVKYYNEVVATVGNTSITRFELLSAYSSYGESYYVSQLGQSETEALNSTLDLLIDRESLYQYALDNTDIYGLSAYQVNSLIQDIFDSVDEQMDSFITSAKKILNITVTTPDEEESSDETVYKYDDYFYVPRAEVKSNITYYTDADKTTKSETVTAFYVVNYYIDYITEDEPNSFDPLISVAYLNDYTNSNAVKEIVSAYLTHFYNSLNNEDSYQDAIYNKAVSLLSSSLISYEYYLRDFDGKAYNTKTDDLLYRYFERNFTTQIKSQYLTNIRIHYLATENLSVNDLVTQYQNLVWHDYAKYVNHHDTYNSAIQSIGTDGDTILYHPDTDVQFGYFSHALFKLSDKQISELAALEKNKASISEQKYQTEYDTIISKITVRVRDLDTGLLTETPKTLSEIFTEYNAITNISDYAIRLSEFVKFMFKYTGDTGTLAQTMPYVVGTDDYSDMEKAFTEEAVRLMTEGTKGDMTPADIDNLVVTSYGVHVLFYLGDVNMNDIAYTSTDSVFIANDRSGALNLYYKEINPLTHETYFDMLFDKVYPASSDTENYTSNTGYSTYESNLIKLAGKSYPVVKYSTKINATTV